MPEYLPAIITGAAVLIVGYGAGWMTHALALSRDKVTRDHADKNARDARIRVFTAFLRKWRSEIDTKNPKDIDGILAAYGPNRPIFWAEVERVRPDLSDPTKFQKLTDAVACVQRTAVEQDTSGDHRNPIVEPIDALLEFTRNA